MNKVNWMQQGWECPKCGAVMSPHTDACINCRGNGGTFITGTTIEDPKSTGAYHRDSSITTSTSGPLDPPYVLKKSNHDGLWVKASLNEHKEDPEEQWERYQLNV